MSQEVELQKPKAGVPTLTVEQIKAHPLFLVITTKQQQFVLAYLASRDRLIAAKETWNCADDDSASVFANRALSKPAVQALIGLYFGIGATGGPMGRTELRSLFASRLRSKDLSNSEFIKLAYAMQTLTGAGRLYLGAKPGPRKNKPATESNPDPLAVPLDMDVLVREIEKQREKERNGQNESDSDREDAREGSED